MLGKKTSSGHGQMISKDTELFPSRERVTHTKLPLPPVSERKSFLDLAGQPVCKFGW